MTKSSASEIDPKDVMGVGHPSADMELAHPHNEPLNKETAKEEGAHGIGAKVHISVADPYKKERQEEPNDKTQSG